MSHASSSPFAGGPKAVRYSQTRTAVLCLPLFLAIAVILTIVALLSPATAQRRSTAVQNAWAAGGSEVQQQLSQCLTGQQGARYAATKGKRFAFVSLMDDVESCEKRGTQAAARNSISQDNYLGPSAASFDEASKARVAVFSSTLRINKADLGLRP